MLSDSDSESDIEGSPSQEPSYFIQFSVSDSGIGIKDEDKNKLFKMFGKIYQQDKSINPAGIGLGLTICDKIIKQFGGILSFESVYGVGTQFSFTLELPLAKLE